MRLIDVDNLTARLRNIYKERESHPRVREVRNEVKGIIDSLIDVIDEEPTVDPVKHAHWIAVNPDSDGKNASMFECSNCDATVHFHFFVKNSDCRKSCGYYYCPQCGARMDEEVTTE